MKAFKKISGSKKSLVLKGIDEIESTVYLITSTPFEEPTESGNKSRYKIHNLKNQKDLIEILTKNTLISRMWAISMFSNDPKGLITTYPIHKIERCRSKMTGEDMGIYLKSEDVGHVINFGGSQIRNDDVEVVYTIAHFQ